MPLIRLDKMLAAQGLGTRSEVRELIRRGAVRVGGEQAKSADAKIDTGLDRVFVGDREVTYKEHVYIVMNKPQGVVSASRDPKERTVIDLLPPSLRRPGLFPAGRLDKDTVGLMIITDDGPFAHRILSPKKHVVKRYFAKLDIPADEEDIAAFKRGVELSDGQKCLPAGLKMEDDGVCVTISEGRYHQIKRMFETRGKKVVFLKRLSIGGLSLDEGLSEGSYRELATVEIADIFK